MEHTCYKCGAIVDESAAFCPNCNAPQIRVAVAEQNQPATAPLAPGTPGDIQPPAQPVHFEQYAPYGSGNAASPEAAQHVRWSDALPSTLLAGGVIALAWIVPFAGFLLWPIAAGGLAIALYLRRRPEAAVTPGVGARVGAISGVFGFVMFAVLMAIDLVALRGGGRLRDAMQQVIQQSAARNPNPETQAMIARMLSPEGVAFLVVLVLVIFLAMFVGFGAIGGALGANLLRKRKTNR